MDTRGEPFVLDQRSVDRAKQCGKFFGQALEIAAAVPGGAFNEMEVAAEDLEAMVSRVDNSFHADA
jgi:hypothetical protein